MQKFCSTYQFKTVLLIVWLLFGLYGFSQSSDTSNILFYSIKNVSTEWSSIQLEKSNSSEDIQKYLKQNTSSSQEVKDAYLVPTVLNLISETTNFSELNNFKDRKKIKSQYEKTNEYLIIISLNKFGDLIEYQFHLSHYYKGVYDQIKESSFFIDPRNQNYYNTIKKEIQLIFNGPLGKNQPPIPQIRLDGQIVDKENQNQFYRSNQDTILLDGFSSEDDNTPKKYLEYKWRVEKQGEQNAFIRDFNFEKSQQVLVINDPGVYTFYLNVSDGVAWSKDSSANVTLHILKKSKLELHKSAEYIIQNSLFKNRVKSFKKSQDPISFYISDNQPQSVLKFSYVDSYTRKQKYFLDASPVSMKNQLNLKFNSTALEDSNPHHAKLSGIMVDTSFLQNPGIINYHLGANIKPGVHIFTLNTEHKGIKSNVDTVSIAYREKSALNFSFGLLNYDILKGGEYDDRISLNTVKFGFRTYFTERISADLDVLFPNKAQNEIFGDSISFSIHSFVFKLNYDLFPFKSRQFISGDSFAYLTFFASFHQMIIIDGDEDTEVQMVGIGIKPRMQLFKNYKKLGVLYLEGEIGYQSEPCIGCGRDAHFESWSYGVSLIYGFLNY